MNWKEIIPAVMAGAIVSLAGTFFAFQGRVTRLETQLENADQRVVAAVESTLAAQPIPPTLVSESTPYPTYTLYPTHTPFSETTSESGDENSSDEISDINNCSFDSESEKILVTGIRVHDQNEYSSGYSAEKIVDNNTNTYWSTISGRTHDNILDLSFMESIAIDRIELFIPDKRGGYTPPLEIEAVFFDSSGALLGQESIGLFSSQTAWSEYDFSSPVCNVSMMQVKVVKLARSIANFLTINEMRVYGWQQPE